MLHQVEEVFILLLAVSGIVLLARKIAIPYPILLVLGGLVIASIPGLPKIQLQPDLIFFIFLPPLLFPAALFTSWRDFHANLRPIMLLAVGLVLFTTCSVGYLTHHFVHALPLAAAFILGAIISPPDAVAATSVTERLRIPQRIVTIIEGESLVNDAIALVAYQFAVSALLTGKFSLPDASLKFVIVALGGVAVGLAIGWLATNAQRRMDDPPVQITISLITPFAAYLLSEQLGVSGVLAVVTTGLYVGWRAPEIITARMRLQAGPIWRMVVFLLNGMVFILIGLQLPEVLKGLSGQPTPILTLCGYALEISLLVIVVRFAWVFAATYLPRLLSWRRPASNPAPSWRNVVIIAWTGMRGVVSLAAAMALPSLLMNETVATDHSLVVNLIIFFTYVVILVTLVLQGLTLPLLIRWLKVVDDGVAEKEENGARLKANRSALLRLFELEEQKDFPPDMLQRLRIEYEDHIQQLENFEKNRSATRSRLFSLEYEKLQKVMLRVERETILRLRNERIISDHALRSIQHDLDLAEARLERED